MIHSLLSVCLLTMGVGAKASTPIELNRQQTQYENTTQPVNTLQATSSWTGTINELWYKNTPTDHDGEYIPGYVIENTVRQEYVLTNTNINIELAKYGTYEYNRLMDDNDQPIDNVMYVNSDYMTYNKIDRPKEVYIYKIFGSNLGFQNFNLELRLDQGEIGYETTVNVGYEIFENTELVMYQTTENIDNIFYCNDANQLDYVYEPTRLYKRFTEGNLKASCIKYNITNNYPQTPRINLNINPIANRNNYFCLFLNRYFFVENQYQEQFKQDIKDQYIRFTCGYSDNPIHSQISQVEYRPVPVPTTYSNITGEIVEITQINQEIIDLPGLLWEILAMPFAFISTAFNLTLFPGTAYALNISNLILTIFGVLVFVYILKKIKP